MAFLCFCVPALERLSGGLLIAILTNGIILPMFFIWKAVVRGDEPRPHEINDALAIERYYIPYARMPSRGSSHRTFEMTGGRRYGEHLEHSRVHADDRRYVNGVDYIGNF